MPSEQEYRKAEEVLDLQEKYFLEQLKRHGREIARLKRTRRRRILQRSLALFLGVVLVLLGFINLILVQELEVNFNNIIIFTLAELIAIPLLRYGLVLFRKMPIEQEITATVEQFVQIQDSIAQLRDERLRLIRTPISAVRQNIPPPESAEPPVTFDEHVSKEPSPVCPECGEKMRDGAKICRKCGHLFV